MHISISPWVITSEAVGGQIMALLISMSQSKMVILMPIFESC